MAYLTFCNGRMSCRIIPRDLPNSEYDEIELGFGPIKNK